MGLDMYIYARKNCFVSSWIDESKGQIKCELPKELDAFKDLDEVKNSLSINFNIDYKIGYWRKANHIHKWFVDNCGDGVDECQDMYVSKEDLENLLKVCNEVLAEHGDAEKKLPTQSGFFFGGTEYDEYYFNEVKYTKEVCEKAIQFLDERTKAKDYLWSIHYQASW